MRWWWKYTKYDPYEVIIGKMGRNIGGKKKNNGNICTDITSSSSLLSC